MVKNRIGVAIITCDRYVSGFLEPCVESWINKGTKSPSRAFIIINDGTERVDLHTYHSSIGNVIQGTTIFTPKPYSGVAVAKNTALKKLIELDCEHLFLIEDDVKALVDPQYIFEQYIETSKSTGIKHLNFGCHGDHNKLPNGDFLIRHSIKIHDAIIDLYPNLLGAFSYYHKSVIDDIGYMDETYYNAMEHVDHTYQAIKRGYHPPFRWFADVHKSHFLIGDIVPDHHGSVIRKDTEDWIKKFRIASDYFVQKNGFTVAPQISPGPSETKYTLEDVTASLKQIWNSNQAK